MLYNGYLTGIWSSLQRGERNERNATGGRTHRRDQRRSRSRRLDRMTQTLRRSERERERAQRVFEVMMLALAVRSLGSDSSRFGVGLRLRGVTRLTTRNFALRRVCGSLRVPAGCEMSW